MRLPAGISANPGVSRSVTPRVTPAPMRMLLESVYEGLGLTLRLGLCAHLKNPHNPAPDSSCPIPLLISHHPHQLSLAYFSHANNRKSFNAKVMVEEMVKRVAKKLNKSPETAIMMPQGTVEGVKTTGGPAGGPTPDTMVESREAGQENLSYGKSARIEKDKDPSHETNSDDSFKEIPNPNPTKVVQQGQDTVSRYRNLLSGVPEIIKPEGALQVTTLSIAPTTPELSFKNSDKQAIWDKATEALARGDKKSADFFLRIYARMKENSSLDAPDRPETLRSSSSDAVNPSLNTTKRTVNKTTIVFIKGSLSKHFDVGFTPYFNRNIREFRGPIPLTIFDKNWQRDAIQFYTNRRTRGDKKDGNYIGYEYPNKWSQTFSKWTTNHRNFYLTFRDLYNYPEFAEWILLHKENVNKIISAKGFMTAFRYDMIVRQNAFSYQVTTDTGEVSAVDISMFRDDVKREAWRITLTLSKNDETDNPYAIGGEKFGFDPNTGKPRPKNPKGGANEDVSKQESSSGRGKGGYCGRGLGDRWGQDRHNSDYGGYNDYHQNEDGYNA
ncbi:hypothetical protein PTTG_25499 [Puccinia triticina 1-1 BBBD Race 1]|uniref:Uncharacterized protein n=1 Tax=Puccinia triticina (isolate 1-1 / race 1 (BBBD)) TaxID=630390 RepID=A0A180H1X2_PUCT1|nr:hypothetical protein PTTG_25499 [Puccinia triticina 1-1 BBBD Race 1]